MTRQREVAGDWLDINRNEVEASDWVAINKRGELCTGKVQNGGMPRKRGNLETKTR